MNLDNTINDLQTAIQQLTQTLEKQEKIRSKLEHDLRSTIISAKNTIITLKQSQNLQLET